MKNRHFWLAGVLVAMGYAPAAQAQGIPGVSSSTIAAAGSAASAVGPVAAPRTIWSFLGCSWEQKEECRRMLCKLPIGQMLNNASAPIGAMTGGLIPAFCPATPSEEQLKDQGAVGAAAKIKADEAAAKERRAAVRFLGTVDCHYWEEAQDALIAALRTDKNECVRYEAALALRNGCCCTKKTMEALMNVLTCSRDGGPSETSARVHFAARQALDKCLSCYADMNPPAPEKNTNPEKKDDNVEKKGEGARLIPRKIDEVTSKNRPVGKEYYDRIKDQPLEAIVREGRRVLAATQQLAVAPSSGNSLARLFERSTGLPETQGYIVHGGQPGKVELVASKPNNLWELLSGRSQPVVVSSYPAKSLPVESVPQRAMTQPATMPVVQANPMPTSTATATVNNPAMMTSRPAQNAPVVPVQTVPTMTAPTVQPPPAMPVNKSAPPAEKQVSSAVTPQKAPVVVAMAPKGGNAEVATTPAQKAAPVSKVATTGVIQPAQMTTPATSTAAASKTQTVAVKANTSFATETQATNSMQVTLQKISMGNAQDRLKALDGLTEKTRATPELTAQLIKTAEEDRDEQVRCSAIKAMVRPRVPADRAIPVLSQLGMNLESTIGKEANNALAQINLRLVQE